VRAVEDLVGAVRDHETRRLLGEAVRAYHAGALRSAINATWVVLAADLIAKIRELAGDGDPGAVAFVGKLDQAIATANVAVLQRIEHELLVTARDEFELIGSREFAELERLHTDRHICAHPAFVAAEQVFEPSPELVRAHMAAAVNAVLAHPPTPGKRAVARFTEEITTGSLPDTLDQLTPYLRDRYFDRAKTSLRSNVALLIIKGCIDPPDAQERVAQRCALAAHALDRIDPGLLADALNRVVRRREEGTGLPDVQLLRMVGTLGDLGPAWSAIPESSRPRVQAVLRSAPVPQLVTYGAFNRTLPPDVAAIVDVRAVEVTDRDTLAAVIAIQPSPLFFPAALRETKASLGYRSAEANMEQLILPFAPVLTAEQLVQVLSAVESNNQLHHAARMPSFMVNLFTETLRLWPQTADAWRALCRFFLEHDPADGYYTYPDLQALVAARSEAPS